MCLACKRVSSKTSGAGEECVWEEVAVKSGEVGHLMCRALSGL